MFSATTNRVHGHDTTAASCRTEHIVATTMKSVPRPFLKCCFTSTETIGLVWTGAQDVHPDSHPGRPPRLSHYPELCLTLSLPMDLTVPSLCSCCPPESCFMLGREDRLGVATQSKAGRWTVGSPEWTVACIHV